MSYFAAARELGAAVTDTADTPAVRLDQILRTDSLSSILTAMDEEDEGRPVSKRHKTGE